jgi:hypothetical protein
MGLAEDKELKTPEEFVETVCILYANYGPIQKNSTQTIFSFNLRFFTIKNKKMKKNLYFNFTMGLFG